MKKLTKAAALLAATALLFGTVACNSDDGNDNTSGNGGNSQPSSTGSDPSSGGNSGGSGSGGDSGSTVTTVTYTWDFSTPSLISVPAWSGYDSSSVTSGTELLKVKLDANATYESTPAGLTLAMPQDSQYNKVSPNQTKSSSVTADGATNGAIELGGNVVDKEFSVSVKGPFTVKMIDGANGSSDKTDRYAFIKINGTEVAAPNKAANTIPVAGEVISYSYTGEDTVTVSFGATKIVRIFTIQIETTEVDAGTRTAGEVLSLGSFTTAQDNSTANDLATLGLVGTSASSDAESVATVEINDGKIVIASVAQGTATITVTDGTQSATIPVTVGATGTITVGTIVKYVPASPVKNTDYTVEDAKLTAINAIEYSTDGGENWTALQALEVYTATESSSVLVRFAAGTYNASPAVTVILTPSGAAEDLTVYNFTELFDTYGTSAEDISISSDTAMTTNGTYYFNKGIVWVTVSNTDTELKKQATSTGDTGFEIDTTHRIKMAKTSSANSTITIPVKGKCTIKTLWYCNGTSERGVYATTSTTGANVTNGGTYYGSAKAYYTAEASYVGSAGEVVLSNLKNDGTAGGGAIYVYAIIVAYSND